MIQGSPGARGARPGFRVSEPSLIVDHGVFHIIYKDIYMYIMVYDMLHFAGGCNGSSPGHE